MPTPVTISLPFSNNDDLPPAKWYHGSRLRNRTLMLAASGIGFILLLIMIRRISYGSSAITSIQVPSIQQHPAPHTIYEGADVVFGLLTHLVIIPGHAIWVGGQTYQNDSDWLLEPMQAGQTQVFVDHIKKGASMVASAPNSLLVFSGGESRSNANGRTESQSYAALLNLLIEKNEAPPGVTSRATTEQYARDSYENLLFSIARFFEVVGQYPSQVTIIGYEFKRKRYMDLHRSAIKFPVSHFEYIGIDPADFDAKAAEVGETNNARALFEKDLYGCHHPTLTNKKKLRNPARRRHGYELSNKLLASLIDYCPLKNELYPGELPW